MAADNTMQPDHGAGMERYPWHDALWPVLTRQLDRLPHALLLQGRPGLGKHAFALQLARALLCEQPQAGNACGHCHACHLFSAGSHPDFHVLQPEELTRSSEDVCGLYGTRYPPRDGEKKRDKPSADITVYQVRSLIEDMQIRPYHGNRRLALFTPADAMNLSAANSLLKLLEEPPSGSMLLLVTSHPVRLPATIRSRCSRLLFRPPSAAMGSDWLKDRLKTRDIPARLLVFAGGAPLLAEHLMHEEFPQNRVKLLQDLQALSQGRENPVACAARWNELGAARCLGWLHGFGADLVKISLGAKGSTLLNPEAESFRELIGKKNKISGLYALIDTIHEYYRQLNSTLDELLMLEDVLIRWVRLSRLQ